MTTKIEWTDETWNPVTGCSKVSQGCKNCYAERLAPKVFAGQVVEVDTTPPKHPEMKASAFRPRAFTDVLCHPERLDAPLHWKKPRRIFVNSMSDLFHEDVPDKFIDDCFRIMVQAPQHQFQILTKRPARMLSFYQSQSPHRTLTTETKHIIYSFPLDNVWLGVSVEDQATADERIPLLLATPAAVRFISYEPALGPIDLYIPHAMAATDPRNTNEHATVLDWVIAGGESGPNARPSHPDWFRAIRDQCAAAGVPFFFKQWGEWAPETVISSVGAASRALYVERDGSTRPAAFGTRGNAVTIQRNGKRAAGRLLDGKVHDEYPA